MIFDLPGRGQAAGGGTVNKRGTATESEDGRQHEVKTEATGRDMTLYTSNLSLDTSSCA